MLCVLFLVSNNVDVLEIGSSEALKKHLTIKMPQLVEKQLRLL